MNSYSNSQEMSSVSVSISMSMLLAGLKTHKSPMSHSASSTCRSSRRSRRSFSSCCAFGRTHRGLQTRISHSKSSASPLRTMTSVEGPTRRRNSEIPVARVEVQVEADVVEATSKSRPPAEDSLPSSKVAPMLEAAIVLPSAPTVALEASAQHSPMPTAHLRPSSILGRPQSSFCLLFHTCPCPCLCLLPLFRCSFHRNFGVRMRLWGSEA